VKENKRAMLNGIEWDFFVRDCTLYCATKLDLAPQILHITLPPYMMTASSHKTWTCFTLRSYLIRPGATTVIHLWPRV